MVLGKMLMEIDPLPMRGSLVMTMVMISPSRREVSPAEQVRQSPRLVPPRFRLVAAESRPERWLVIFFPHRKTPYSRRWASEGHQGAHEVGGAPPTLMGRVWPPLNFLRSLFFIYSENVLCEVSGLLELCRMVL